nr:thioesterase domain-containing protein [Saccharopolyspora karakumensis]
MSTKDDVTTAWIRRYRPSATSTTRLVCFPHAGGSASFFHPPAPHFSPDTDVVSLQYPGRQDRRNEPCVEDIETLADLLTDDRRAQRQTHRLLRTQHRRGAGLRNRVPARAAGSPRAPLGDRPRPSRTGHAARRSGAQDIRQ